PPLRALLMRRRPPTSSLFPSTTLFRSHQASCMRRLIPFLAVIALMFGPACASAAIPVYGYRVMHVYPHDTHAYTEGLFYLDGHLYESTGQVGHSGVRRVDLATGKVIQQTATPWPAHGEGNIAWKNRLIQLSWRRHEGFIYDLKTLKPLARFGYPGEGWALTRDRKHIYMSDGTSVIRVLDPGTLQQVD